MKTDIEKKETTDCPERRPFGSLRKHDRVLLVPGRTGGHDEPIKELLFWVFFLINQTQSTFR